MRFLLLPILFAGLALWARGDAAKDLDKLQGTWVASQVTYNGKDHNKLKLRFTIKKDQIVVEGTDDVKKEYAKIGFKLDASTKPHCIDITVMAGGQEGAKMEGIYELKDDELKICVKVFGMDRPNEFAAPEGASTALVVLKREK
jgi:uncharacterized protein (TIGR03067 family)